MNLMSSVYETISSSVSYDSAAGSVLVVSTNRPHSATAGRHVNWTAASQPIKQEAVVSVCMLNNTQASRSTQMQLRVALLWLGPLWLKSLRLAPQRLT